MCGAGDPITGPSSLSTVDLSGTPVPGGGGEKWTCSEVPVDEVAKYSTKALNFLEKIGFDLIG